ncbi:uncharacterized protein J3D65DRAFT_670612 [Phyllosticta citribraziliensis]|uniref:F-box domain-containing protein n=1 Tax=Phyllosticta citribraziliensis TaxID=989973 RepID=A0ABR1LBB0_9PEZI
MSTTSATATMARNGTASCVIFKLPDELLLRIVRHVEEGDIDDAVGDNRTQPSNRSVFPLRQTNHKFRQLCDESVFRTVSIMRKMDRPLEHVCENYVPLAQRNLAVDSPEILEFFGQPDLHHLRKTRSVAFHQFWHANGCLPADEAWALRMIATGLRTIMQAPERLRRLHLDGEHAFATALEHELELMPAARVALANVEEIIISVEFAFILKYTHNVTRLSNKTLMGRTTGESSDWLRAYTTAQVNHFFDMCSSLPKLRTMELTIRNFQYDERRDSVMAASVLPPMALTKLSFIRESVPSFDDFYVDADGQVTMGLVLRMARSQPALEEYQIPEPEDIALGNIDTDIHWKWEHELTDLLPAAVVAAKVRNIKRVFVGPHATVDITRKASGTTRLRLTRNKAYTPRSGRSYWSYYHDETSHLWTHRWDAWKEPLVHHHERVDKEAVSDFSVEVVLCVDHVEGDAAAYIEKDDEEVPQTVVVNILNPFIEVVDLAP